MEELKYFCSTLLTEMESELFEIRLEWTEAPSWSKKSIPTVKGSLNKLKTYIVEHPFKRRSEEIYFFKEVKPAFMGKLIFYVGVYNIEAERPISVENSSTELDYLSLEIDNIQQFFDQQENLYEYYKQQDDVLDTKLFLRHVEDPFTFRDLPLRVDAVSYYGDPDFSTGFDYLFAQFRGYEQLRDYLENEIDALSLLGDDMPTEELKFTGSQADFVEFVGLFKTMVKPTHPVTGEPLNEDQIAEMLKELFHADWGNASDFETLKLISGNSDLPEQMTEALKKLKRKWDEEEGDKEYGDGDNT